MKTYKKPVDIAGIRNITISGKIGTGKSTLSKNLSEVLGWELMDGGKIFRKYAKEYGFDIAENENIPDDFDKAFEEKTKEILQNKEHFVFQSHLAGFIAQGIKGVYKILVVCESENNGDDQNIRIKRVMDRDKVSLEQATKELKEREERLVKKFRKLYVANDPNWFYWDKKYYDLIVNTFSLNQQEALSVVLKNLHYDV